MDEVEQRALELGQRILRPAASGWPTTRFEALALARDAPKQLFVRGTLPNPAQHAAGIVGTRRATAYGLDTARSIAERLARHGVWIISGLALGIDTAAHEAALIPNGGRTVAVLGTGVDVRYPASNTALRERIPKAGALVSEYEPGARATRFTFPRRNRLIAALSDVVVVVEAPRRSGALITARLAASMGRGVLAVPGHVRRETQAGCHALLQDQVADLCLGADDVLRALELPTDASGRRRTMELTGAESAVLDQLDIELACGLDAIARGSGLSPAAVTMALTRLELEQLARRIPGVGYVRA